MGNTIKTGMLASVIAFGGALSAVAATVTVSQDTTWTSGTYDAVVVENATLTIDGEVNATGNVDIGSSNGGATVDVASGYLGAASFRFGVNVPESFSGDYLNKMFIRSGAKTTASGSFSHNSKFPSLLTFDGGIAQFGSYAVRDIFSAATTNLTLRGVNGHDISLFFSFTGGRALGFLKDWSDLGASCRLRTEGECDVVLDANDIANIRMRVYGFSQEKTQEGYHCIDWQHTGDLLIKNRINMVLDGEMMLPFGVQTGGVVVDGNYAVLDFNGHRAALNSIEVKNGAFKNSSTTAATLAFCVAEGSKNLSDVLKASPTGAFDYEKIGAGTLAVDKTVGDKWTVTEGALAFAATAATPANKVIVISELAVNSPAMTTLVVDGVNVSCGSLTGSMRDKLLVVTRNGGTFDCPTFSASDDRYIHDYSSNAGDVYVKLGERTDTIVTKGNLESGFSVQKGTCELRPDWDRTHGNFVRFTFTGSYNAQPLSLCNINVWGYSSTDTKDKVARQDGATADKYNEAATLEQLINGDGNYGWILISTPLKTGSSPLNYLFNPSQTWNGNVVFDAVPTLANPVVITVKLRWWNASVSNVCGYNFLKKGNLNSGVIMPGFPTAWIVETSADGQTWKEVDRRSGMTPPSDGWSATGFSGQGTRTLQTTTAGTSATFFPIAGHEIGAAGGISSASSVRVDSGATLDLSYVSASSREIGSLLVDSSVGGGKITDFEPAATGEIRFVNVADKVQANSPILTFDRVTSPENVGNWTVFVNGKATRKSLYVANGALYLRNPGLLFVVR